MLNDMHEYDSIAEAYKKSKELAFRGRIERHTLFEMLGDIRGKTVLDLACGEGFYTRLLKQAGAAEVTGVDISSEMIHLAEEEEGRNPLGCTYVQQDVAEFEPPQAVDVVVAMYLLNYANTGTQLRRFCRVCYHALRPGGRFVGFNDNILNPPKGTVSLKKYGIEKTCVPEPREGDAILYTITNNDGTQFRFSNYYLTPETYREAFREAGFENFQWGELVLQRSERDSGFWDELMADRPVLPFSASRP